MLVWEIKVAVCMKVKVPVIGEKWIYRHRDTGMGQATKYWAYISVGQCRTVVSTSVTIWYSYSSLALCPVFSIARFCKVLNVAYLCHNACKISCTFSQIIRNDFYFMSKVF